MNKIINFLKENGLNALSKAVTGNYIGALLSLSGLTGTSNNEDDIIASLKNNPEMLLKLKEQENKYVESILGDKRDARNMTIKLNESNNSSWLQKNISALIAIVWVLFCIYLYWISLTGKVGKDAQMNSTVVSSITNITMLIIGFYFGSSEVRKT